MTRRALVAAALVLITALVLVTAPARADAPFAIDVRGCPPVGASDALARFLAIEGHDLSSALHVTVHVSCTDEARATVLLARPSAVPLTREVDLSGSEGEARWWSLALVIVELARTPVTPLPTAPEPRVVPELELGIGVVGWLAFDGPSGFGALELSVRWQFLRVALDVGFAHRPRRLGDVYAGLVLLDVALAPLRHDFDEGAVLGELFAEGGPGYGAGRRAEAPTHALDALFGYLGVGAGVRLTLGPIDLAARLGYALLGSELADDDGVAIRLAGLFGSLAVGVVVAP
ncbi:MAG: hypothetical protein AB7S26_43075 [Sandaracinaceae bacterium]